MVALRSEIQGNCIYIHNRMMTNTRYKNGPVTQDMFSEFTEKVAQLAGLVNQRERTICALNEELEQKVTTIKKSIEQLQKKGLRNKIVFLMSLLLIKVPLNHCVLFPILGKIRREIVSLSATFFLSNLSDCKVYPFSK